jgi:hypothetical protein
MLRWIGEAKMSEYILNELDLLIESIKLYGVTEPILYFEREDGSWMRTMFADAGEITTPSLWVPDEGEEFSIPCVQCDLKWKIIERIEDDVTGEFVGELCEGTCRWCKRIEHSMLLVHFYPKPLRVNNQLLIGNVGRFDLTHCSRCAEIIDLPIIITPVDTTRFEDLKRER